MIEADEDLSEFEKEERMMKLKEAAEFNKTMDSLNDRIKGNFISDNNKVMIDSLKDFNHYSGKISSIEDHLESKELAV